VDILSSSKTVASDNGVTTGTQTISSVEISHNAVRSRDGPLVAARQIEAAGDCRAAEAKV
jgi:hypothetical protein